MKGIITIEITETEFEFYNHRKPANKTEFESFVEKVETFCKKAIYDEQPRMISFIGKKYILNTNQSAENKQVKAEEIKILHETIRLMNIDLKALKEQANKTPIICPFCSKGDFDLVGLKIHLSSGKCEAFNEQEIK